MSQTTERLALPTRRQYTPGPWFVAGPSYGGWFCVARVWSSGLYQVKRGSRTRNASEAAAVLRALEV